MRLAGYAILCLWAVSVLPVWLLGMGFAGEFRMLPDYVSAGQFWSMTAAMYIPPLVAAALLMTGRRKLSVRDNHAAN